MRPARFSTPIPTFVIANDSFRRLEAASGIRQRFQEATPFRHVLVEDFLEPAAAESLLADFPAFDRRKAINEYGTVGRKAVVERVTAISPFYRQFYAISTPVPFSMRCRR